jgi:hypothetical protein
MKVNYIYTKEQIEFILDCKNNQNLSWNEITDRFNKRFNTDKTPNSIRKTFNRFEFVDLEELATVDALKKANRATKSKSIVAKELKTVLNYIDTKDDILDEIKSLVKELKVKPLKIPKFKHDKHKPNMTKEIMLTDLHFGKKTKFFNREVARERLKKLTNILLEDITQDSKNFNVEKVIVFLGGDIVESSTMHGEESLSNCEFGNMEQIRVAIESLFHDVILPLASTGIKLVVPSVPGNHCRIDPKKTFNNPGKEYMTWVIYNVLKMLTDAYKLTNIEYIIPEGTYCVLPIYNAFCLYEHGDNHRHDEKSFETHISNRSKQFGKMIDFYRCGHYHTYLMIGRGRIIRNASLVGNDGYSTILGFNSEASQTINSYVETKKRPNPFYKSFPVYLDK